MPFRAETDYQNSRGRGTIEPFNKLRFFFWGGDADFYSAPFCWEAYGVIFAIRQAASVVALIVTPCIITPYSLPDSWTSTAARELDPPYKQRNIRSPSPLPGFSGFSICLRKRCLGCSLSIFWGIKSDTSRLGSSLGAVREVSVGFRQALNIEAHHTSPYSPKINQYHNGILKTTLQSRCYMN